MVSGVCVDAGEVLGVVGSPSFTVKVFLGWLCTAGFLFGLVGGISWFFFLG